MGLYVVKPAAQRMVRPLEDFCVARGIHPDALTAAAVVVAAAGGLCLAVSPTAPIFLWAVPVLATIRIVLNLLDGMVARRTGLARPIGAVWNELGDRVADVLFIGGLAWVPGVDPRLALGAVIGALLASYAGVAAKAAGGARQFVGPMSKPGRMATLSAGSILAIFLGDRWLAAAAAVILVGALVTLLQRVLAARRELRHAA